MQCLKIFVSSTIADLQPHRSVLDDALLAAEHQTLVQERMGAVPADPTTACDDLIQKCDVFVGIYAFRYGHVPEGSDVSITESEYETARRLGKRCLCYLAHEDWHAPSHVAEEEWKRLRQLELRQRIEEELVRGEFGDPNELVTQVLVDLGKLLRGAPLGWVFDDVRERWAGWLEQQQYYAGDVAEHLGPVEPPLAAMWREFVNALPWHIRIEDLLDTIRSATRETPNLGWLAQHVTGIACDASYERLRKRLTELPFTKALRDASQEVNRCKAAYSEAQRASASQDFRRLREALARAQSLRRSLLALERQSRDPDYRRVFLVLGSMGSGKSHLIAHLAALQGADLQGADLQGAENVPALFLLPLRDHKPGSSFGETVLAGIREATGLQWRSVEELDAFLAGEGDEARDPAPRLVIAVDDLHLQLGRDKDLLEDLERHVVEQTHLHRVAWLVTLQDTEYRRVVTHEAFWRRFSFAWRPDLGGPQDEAAWRAEAGWGATVARTAPVVGGWLYLDELNRGDPPLGLRVLESAVAEREQNDVPPLAADWSANKEAVYRLLASPFVAWIVLGLDEEIDPLRIVNLNYVDFIEAFWKQRLQDAGWSPLSDEIVAQQAVALVARGLLDTGEFLPQRGEMVAAVNAIAEKENARVELLEPAGAEVAIQWLERIGLVRLQPADHPILRIVEHIELCMEPFWQWHLARQILPASASQGVPVEAIAKVLQGPLGGDSNAFLREGVAEFLLHLASGRAGGVGADLESELWQQMLEIEPEAVWFAGPKARIAAQRIVVGWLGDRGFRPMLKKTPFGVLYFLYALAPEVLSVTERLRHLQPLFGEIRRASVGSFYLYVAERLLLQVEDIGTLLDVLPYFGGCEDLGFAPVLAQFAAERAFDIADGDIDELLALAFSYMRRVDRRVKREYPAHNSGKKWQRHFFYEWFLKSLFREMSSLSYERQVLLTSIFKRLEALDWYRPKRLRVDWSTGLIMEREANICLGSWYRSSHRKADREGFEKLVQRLSTASQHDKQLAFYLLYQAGAIGGVPAYRLNEECQNVLRKLLFDQALVGVIRHNLDFMNYQLAPLGASETQRIRELRRNAAGKGQRAGSGKRNPSHRRRGRSGRRSSKPRRRR